MNVFLDTNVIVDFLAKRLEFYKDAAIILSSSIKRYTSSDIICTTLYLVESQYNLKFANQAINSLLDYLNIVSTSKGALRSALSSNFKDTEDAIQYFSALEHGNIDYIITRDKKGFAKSEIPVLTPSEFIKKHLS